MLCIFVRNEEVQSTDKGTTVSVTLWRLKLLRQVLNLYAYHTIKCPLKSQIPISGGGGAHGNQFPTFDAVSKFAQIQNSHVQWRGGGGLWKPISNFWCWVQICSNLKFTCPRGGWQWGGGLMEANFQKSTSNFLSPVLNWEISILWWLGGGGGLVETNFQKSTSNFISPVLNWNFHFVGGGGGGLMETNF